MSPRFTPVVWLGTTSRRFAAPHPYEGAPATAGPLGGWPLERGVAEALVHLASAHVTIVLVLHNFHTMLSCLRRFENHLCTPGAFAHVKNPRLCILVAGYLHL